MIIEKAPGPVVTKEKKANPENENIQEDTDTKRIKLEQRKLEIEILEIKKKKPNIQKRRLRCKAPILPYEDAK